MNSIGEHLKDESGPKQMESDMVNKVKSKKKFFFSFIVIFHAVQHYNLFSSLFILSPGLTSVIFVPYRSKIKYYLSCSCTFVSNIFIFDLL